MRTKLFSFAAAAALLVAVFAVQVSAHHSFAAEFDAKRPVKLRGTVVKMEWINPHSWIHIDVKDPATGKVERWMVEGGAPNALLRRGWNKNSLTEGTEILVEGFQAKDGANRANGRDITFPDGKVEQWMIEGGAPNALLRRGWNKNSLLPGTEILVEGFQAKDGALRANGRDITFPDGKKLFVGSSGIGAPDERPEK